MEDCIYFFSGIDVVDFNRVKEPSRELFVTVHKCGRTQHPDSDKDLHQLFSHYGSVERMGHSYDSEVDFLFRFKSIFDARGAQSVLNGRCLYDNCCRLQVQFFHWKVDEEPAAVLCTSVDEEPAAVLCTEVCENQSLTFVNEENSVEIAAEHASLKLSMDDLNKELEELEEVLARTTEQLESTNRQQEQDLLVAQNRIASFETAMRELTEKLGRSEELFRICSEKLVSIEAERDDAVWAAEELRRTGERCLSEFSFVEIQRGTDNFNPSMVIKEHSYGTVMYRGFIRHANVALKMFQTDSNRGKSRFHQEIDIMSKLRHPNVATLIGVCQQPRALIYEHFPNGNLEDRLACNDETTPLTWQTRVRIASEICAALVFLHTNRPNCFVHGNLKPKNVLLDGNFTVKLFNFGAFGQRPDTDSASSPHLDPYFLTSGEASTKSDVYSFGVVLLQLLTGRSAVNLAREMQGAVDGLNTSYLTALLDPLAGEWPVSVATELARLGLKCCDMEQNTRPDLGLEVWNLLEAIRDNDYGREEEEAELQPPEYFLCPILQEVMQNPVVAADGFTYERDALRRWLNSGHRTSPMTGADLSNLELVPNHALRSGIQQWLQDH